MDDKELKMQKFLQEQFKRIDEAIRENPERARKITENSSDYVKEQVEKIIKE